MATSNNLNKLQLTRGQWHSGMTESNHLAQAFLTEPYVSDTVGMVFGIRYKTSPLTAVLNSMGNTRYQENREFSWWLMGDSEKSVPVTIASTATYPGQYFQPFTVGFGEKYFHVKDILVSDNGTQVRVESEPYQDGTNWIYTMRLVTYDPTLYLATTQTAVGAEFSKEFTALSEYDSGGYTTASTPFKFINQMTTISKRDDITRSAATDVLVVALPNPQNPKQTTKYWTSYREWLFMQQWYQEQERLMMYSRYNKNSQGEVFIHSEGGRPIYMGAGIEEQIEMGTNREYTKLTENIVSDFLSELSYNKKDFTDRNFVAMTGEYGMREFHSAMKDALQDWNISDVSFTLSGENMNLTFGSQFKKYNGLNGMSLTLMHFPMYDNTVRHRTLHPETKKPTESYKFTVLDFSSNGGSKSNITKVIKKDSENMMWHLAGSVSPFGPAKSLSTMRSHDKDGYTVIALTECGIEITNPISCGQLEFAIA